MIIKNIYSVIKFIKSIENKDLRNKFINELRNEYTFEVFNYEDFEENFIFENYDSFILEES